MASTHSPSASAPIPATSAGESSSAVVSDAAAPEHSPSSSTPTTENGPGASAPASASAHKDPTSREPTPETNVPVRDKESFKAYQLERIIARDKIATAALKEKEAHNQVTIKRRRQEIDEYKAVQTTFAHHFPPSRLYGEGYNGYGNGHTENRGPPRLIYPKDRIRAGKRTAPPLPKPRRKDLKEQAELPEQLVPIRLDVDWDKVKLRDTFTWNLYDRLVPVETFSAHLVEDMGLKGPHERPVYEQVAHQIREQLNDYYPMVFTREDALDPELPYSAYKNDEMRILIKLNITIGSVTLVDQFEWEMNEPENSPEKFARVMAKDLSLSGEFTTAIAHCIREQTQLFTRTLYGIGHPFDGRPVEEPDLIASFLPSPLPTVFRPQQQAKEYAPYLYELSDADLERNEVIFAREQRKQKRSVNRRGGPQLPDLKERQRTIRTMVVSSTIPGAAESIDKTGLFRRVAGAGTGRGKKGQHDSTFSDSDEESDSAPDSPAMSQLAGTARTRGMRGAATIAQQKMAHLGRSETPEVITSHHHETRISSRRFGRALDETPDEPRNYWVAIKIPRNYERVRKMLWEIRTGRPITSGSQTPRQAVRAPSTSVPPGSMGPPLTPSAQQKPPLTKSASNLSQAGPPVPQVGRLSAPPPPQPGQPALPHPHPPEWLVTALADLRKTWPNDSFEATMRHCAVHADTEIIIIPAPQIQPGQPAPENVKWMFLPRIRCTDCPGKLYTPGPEMTATNFEVHLRNKQHRDKVNKRVGYETDPAKASAS
ncbi:SWI/SNF chromatin-remodeling complex subunit snf5 [Cytospora mali]|uniref:SWI/SNF chromatin-remodeling complex subunit snf5 n=1 Tax=Cytospora mali TaxID=578113 RepID=A0A194VP75_CYTMA|nr:SWI/SNF chromatin-remodeling complex subunit snf5 [Valsa mali]